LEVPANGLARRRPAVLSAQQSRSGLYTLSRERLFGSVDSRQMLATGIIKLTRSI
jgi:hypothetical protein